MGHAVATVLDRTGAISRVVEDCVCDRGLNVMFPFLLGCFGKLREINNRVESRDDSQLSGLYIQSCSR